MAIKNIKMYTLQEVADMLRVSRQSVYNWKNEKSLRTVKVGREYRVTEEDLQKFIESRRNI